MVKSDSVPDALTEDAILDAGIQHPAQFLQDWIDLQAPRHSDRDASVMLVFDASPVFPRVTSHRIRADSRG
jgi:hypothetical protein